MQDEAFIKKEYSHKNYIVKYIRNQMAEEDKQNNLSLTKVLDAKKDYLMKARKHLDEDRFIIILDALRHDLSNKQVEMLYNSLSYPTDIIALAKDIMINGGYINENFSMIFPGNQTIESFTSQMRQNYIDKLIKTYYYRQIYEGTITNIDEEIYRLSNVNPENIEKKFKQLTAILNSIDFLPYPYFPKMTDQDKQKIKALNK